MPIINEIDEKDPKNSRTIDTETGVNLQFDYVNGKDWEVGFIINDKKSKIKIDARFTYNLNEEKKTKKYKYFVDNINLYGVPLRKYYFELIKKLLQVHGWQYRRDERRFGNIQSVEITFEPTAIAKLEEWEARYVV